MGLISLYPQYFFYCLYIYQSFDYKKHITKVQYISWPGNEIYGKTDEFSELILTEGIGTDHLVNNPKQKRNPP